VKLTNNRTYLDFNATSPLSPSVTEWLAKGDFAFGNPASIHHTGKQARRQIEQTTEFLYENFGLDETQFDLFYHSGASEGINTLVKGRAEQLYQSGERLHFHSFDTDHSCLVNLRPSLELYGHKTSIGSVTKSGEIDFSKLAREFSPNRPALMNLTWVNNETGVVNSLEKILELKHDKGFHVHVDGVQAIGKLPSWRPLHPELEAYTFSGHKFGALKGVGFSFVKKNFLFSPLIHGGGQQAGLRSGTQNTEGIVSLRLALQDVISAQDPIDQGKIQSFAEEFIRSRLSEVCELVSNDARERALTTFCLRLKNVKANTVLTAFDLAQFDLSSGSACASGAVAPSRALMSMGFTDLEAKSTIRLSFSPYQRLAEVKEIFERVEEILLRFV
jgi:cysteine desulfurase